MDIKNSVNYKTYRYAQYNQLGNPKYDYARFGILNKCLPKIFFKGNSILVSFLQLIDMRLVMMFKQIERVKKFKYISQY